MNIIYKVTDTLNNLSYIGSKMNYVEGSSYLGSPSCKEGHPKYEVQQVFKSTIKNHREKVTLEILEIVNSEEVKTIRMRETFWQKFFNATQSKNFINGIYANATGRTCKKVYCVDLTTYEIRTFNSIEQCEKVLGINNVGAVLLGRRSSTSNQVCLSEEEYEENKLNLIEHVKTKYHNIKQIEKDNLTLSLEVIKTIINIKTKETIQCNARSVFYAIREKGWKRKFTYVYDTKNEDEEYLNKVLNSIKSFTKGHLDNLQIEVTTNNENFISTYQELSEVHGQIKVKLCLQGVTKTINNITLKLK